MHLLRITTLIKAVSAALLLSACAGGRLDRNRHTGQVISKDTTHLHFTVEAAPEWTALFNRTSGWFGGDGIFSIPFSGVDTTQAADSTLLVFSDSMIGEIRNGKLEAGAEMIHNSVAILQGNKASSNALQFYWDKDTTGRAAPLFEPQTPAANDSDYYWLGDGFVNTALNNATYIFGYRIRNISNKDFGFAEVGNALIVLPAGSKPPYREQRQMDTPFFLSADSANGQSSFGAGILVNTRQAGAPFPDGFVYVYGVRGKQKQLLVARVLPENFEKFDQWHYWDGNNWDTDIHKAAVVTDRTSNELSVTPLQDGRYALVFQLDGMGSTIGVRLGLSPAGPFGPVIKLWECPEVKEDRNIFVYNAKAHPNLSKPGELLISYNVNSFNFLTMLNKDPDLYRPRFINVRFLP